MDGVVELASESLLYSGRCFGVQGNVKMGIKQRIWELRRRARSDPAERRNGDALDGGHDTNTTRSRAMSLQAF